MIDYARQHPLEGYRSLTFMMLDADIVAVAPSSTYRVLKAAGLIGRSGGKPSCKGTGFVQPFAPHEHWHVNFICMNIGGVLYFLCAMLDRCFALNPIKEAANSLCCLFFISNQL